MDDAEPRWRSAPPELLAAEERAERALRDDGARVTADELHQALANLSELRAKYWEEMFGLEGDS